jgi:hypothetical protein
MRLARSRRDFIVYQVVDRGQYVMVGSRERDRIRVHPNRIWAELATGFLRC